jgi:two-component system, OmpR family, sensor kinase
LIKHTQEMGAQGAPASISLSHGSMLSPFANAFNNMAARLSSIMRSQKEMTYAVSHELRTPLARMKFALAMAEGSQREPVLQRQLESLGRDVNEMEGLINSLLTYASFEQKAEPLEQREGHMEALVNEMIQRLDNPTGIAIDICNYAPSETYTCEWALMQTALHNLLQNALGFARQNIVVTMGASEQSLWVSVEDDGPGVPEAQRDHIFESFVRLYGESDLNRHSGFGLGLAIAKRMMAWHGGDVSCTRSAQDGAKFTIQWPKI